MRRGGLLLCWLTPDFTLARAGWARRSPFRRSRARSVTTILRPRQAICALSLTARGEVVDRRALHCWAKVRFLALQQSHQLKAALQVRMIVSN